MRKNEIESASENLQSMVNHLCVCMYVSLAVVRVCVYVCASTQKKEERTYVQVYNYVLSFVTD